MHRMIFAIFTSVESANKALEDLNEAGYRKEDMSVVVQDSVYQERIKGEKASTVDNVAGGALSGAATGGTLGALLGLLAGLAIVTIPGLGAVLIGGPVAAALGLTGAAATTVSGAVTGALAGGLIGSLVGLGVPKEQAEKYEARIKEGNILLILNADNTDTADQAENILKNNGAEDINYYTAQ